jgi:hypothetical protein
MYYLKFNKDTGRIKGLSNVKPDSDFLEIDEKTFLKFAEDKSERDNYIVKYNVGKKDYVLIPYQTPKPVYDIKDIVYHVPYTEKADCLITKHQDKWNLTVSSDDLLLHPHRLCKFSVTLKNDIHMLVRTFETTVEEITNGLDVSFTDEDERGEVSIYTSKVFNSYGIVNANT